VELARLGQVLVGAGTVDGTEVLPASGVAEMLTPSQELNRAYGLLTWLNGQRPIRLPMLDEPLDTWLLPNGPPDAVAMLGGMGQLCIVSPSYELLVVRLRGSGGLGGAIGSTLANDIWEIVPFDDLRVG
jgi:CubicO group peptidase (beta-lactamase class C family)